MRGLLAAGVVILMALPMLGCDGGRGEPRRDATERAVGRDGKQPGQGEADVASASPDSVATGPQTPESAPKAEPRAGRDGNAEDDQRQAMAQAFDKAINGANTCDAKDRSCAALVAFRKFLAGYSEYGRDEFRRGMALATNPRVKYELIRRIKKEMDDSLMPVLAPYLTSHDSSLRRLSQSVAASIGTDLALSKLVAALDNKERTETIRSSVPTYLKRHPEHAVVRAAVPKLKLMAKKCRQGVGRMNATEAVAAIEGAQAVGFLIDVARTDAWDRARVAAIALLARFRSNPQAVKALRELAEDKDDKVNAAAKKALEETH